MKSSISGNKRRAVQIVLAAGVAIGAPQAGAATDYFLKISNLPGESTDDKHKDEIDVISFSQTLDEKDCRLAIVKNVDRATPGLAELAARKGSIGSATLVSRRAGTKDAVEFYTLTIQGATVVSVDSAFTAEQAPAEEVVLSPRSFTISYRPQTASGALGAEVKTSVSCNK